MRVRKRRISTKAVGQAASPARLTMLFAVTTTLNWALQKKTHLLTVGCACTATSSLTSSTYCGADRFLIVLGCVSPGENFLLITCLVCSEFDLPGFFPLPGLKVQSPPFQLGRSWDGVMRKTLWHCKCKLLSAGRWCWLGAAAVGFDPRSCSFPVWKRRKKERSDATIVALKMVMNLYFPLPSSHNRRWVYTFPCQKFALFVSPFTQPVFPS